MTIVRHAQERRRREEDQEAAQAALAEERRGRDELAFRHEFAARGSEQLRLELQRRAANSDEAAAALAILATSVMLMMTIANVNSSSDGSCDGDCHDGTGGDDNCNPIPISDAMAMLRVQAAGRPGRGDRRPAGLPAAAAGLLLCPVCSSCYFIGVKFIVISYYDSCIAYLLG